MEMEALPYELLCRDTQLKIILICQKTKITFA